MSDFNRTLYKTTVCVCCFGLNLGLRGQNFGGKLQLDRLVAEKDIKLKTYQRTVYQNVFLFLFFKSLVST